MKNEISTKLVKLNWKGLINNATNKKFWGISYLIYMYDDINIYLELFTINVLKDSLDFKLRGELNGVIVDYEFLMIPIHKEHFNETVFNRHLFKKIVSLLSHINNHKLRRHDYYSYASDNDHLIYRNDIKKALRELEKVTDRDIRLAYLDKFSVSTTSRVEFLCRNAFKLVKGAYLNLCLLMDNEDVYNQYKDLDTRIIKGFKKVKELK